MGRYVGETALAAVGASYALSKLYLFVLPLEVVLDASVIISHHFGGHNYGRRMNWYSYCVTFISFH